jgi:hypothetical protein
VDVEPVESNRSARVVFTRYSTSLDMADGMIAVDPSLQVVGIPEVSVIDATHDQLKQVTITGMTPTSGGFSFHAAWPPLDTLWPDGYVRMTVRATFGISCAPGEAGAGDGGAIHQVQATTYVDLCRGPNEHGEWVSSGDDCTVCRIIAEMAPSPIVPDKTTDDLPLARALRLRIAPLARVGRAVLLFAENDGGDDVSYDWEVSAGTLERLAGDIVIWRLPEQPGGQLLQLAVCASEGVAVASFAWEEAAWAQALVA